MCPSQSSRIWVTLRSRHPCAGALGGCFSAALELRTGRKAEFALAMMKCHLLRMAIGLDDEQTHELREADTHIEEP